jgi:hypothetical protein
MNKGKGLRIEFATLIWPQIANLFWPHLRRVNSLTLCLIF